MSIIKTLALDIGHNVNFDGGAIGIRSEDELNMQVGTRLLQRLKSTNLKVVNCTPTSATSLTNSLRQRCNIANNFNADLFLSIHHNACPGGYGSEVLCIPGGIAEDTGRVILKEISKLGFRNRGIKDRGDLYVIRNTVMPALVVECAFVDSESDMSNYNPIAIADAIFNGLVIALELKQCFEPSNTYKDNIYIVQAGDTLWGISKKFNTSIDAIVDINNIENRNLIYVGQALEIRWTI